MLPKAFLNIYSFKHHPIKQSPNHFLFGPTPALPDPVMLPNTTSPSNSLFLSSQRRRHQSHHPYPCLYYSIPFLFTLQRYLLLGITRLPAICPSQRSARNSMKMQVEHLPAAPSASLQQQLALTLIIWISCRTLSLILTVFKLMVRRVWS